MNFKRYAMRRIRRECYRNYRRQTNSNKKKVINVPRKNITNNNVSGLEVFIIWMTILVVIGFFIFAFTI